MESFHCLLTRSIRIVAMDLKDVNVVHTKTFETVLDRLEDMLATQSYK